MIREPNQVIQRPDKIGRPLQGLNFSREDWETRYEKITIGFNFTGANRSRGDEDYFLRVIYSHYD